MAPGPSGSQLPRRDDTSSRCGLATPGVPRALAPCTRCTARTQRAGVPARISDRYAAPSSQPAAAPTVPASEPRRPGRRGGTRPIRAAPVDPQQCDRLLSVGGLEALGFQLCGCTQVLKMVWHFAAPVHWRAALCRLCVCRRCRRVRHVTPPPIGGVHLSRRCRIPVQNRQRSPPGRQLLSLTIANRDDRVLFLISALRCA